MSFSGFSEDDIRKFSSKSNNVSKLQKGTAKEPTRKVTFKPNRNTNNASNAKVQPAKNASAQLPIPENAKLSVVEKSVTKKDNASQNASYHQTTNEKIVEQTTEKSQEENCLEINRKYKDLDEFEARQKLIEEQNRKRKELLAKALADRTKQTQEEAQKLGEIQGEFQKLDALLSVDVKMLRKKIEIASVDYMEWQKRYHKIEKEFLEAKLLLHQKLEKKELLTEHLCAIIEKNEERKAEKLNELLQKLQILVPEVGLGDAKDNSNNTSESIEDTNV